jgi:predicted ferric reductase
MKPALWPAIMILCLFGAALAWTLTLSSGLPASAYLYEGGRLMALLGFVLLSFQYLWVSRIRFVQAGMAAGQPIRLHRRWGVIALVLLLLHPSFLVVSETLQGFSSPMGALRILGVLALILLAGAGAAALFARRLHLKVRTWKGIHRLAYAVFPIAFAHSLLLGTTLQKTAVRGGWIFLALIYLAHLYQRLTRRSSSRPPSEPRPAS